MEASSNQYTETLKRRRRFDFEAFDKLCAELLDQPLTLAEWRAEKLALLPPQSEETLAPFHVEIELVSGTSS